MPVNLDLPHPLAPLSSFLLMAVALYSAKHNDLYSLLSENTRSWVEQDETKQQLGTKAFVSESGNLLLFLLAHIYHSLAATKFGNPVIVAASFFN